MGKCVKAQDVIILQTIKEELFDGANTFSILM